MVGGGGGIKHNFIDCAVWSYAMLPKLSRWRE